ncbi:MAG TPA: hypothetical protein VKX17_07170 [Planctomycetota bacterium]|nr:hypothetical protein [Planctomycetota bacterium]
MLNDILLTRVQPRPVRLFHGKDFLCALLGSLGFSTKFIVDRTDLTPGQISYRLRRAGVKRADYRNGESALSTTILGRARPVAIPAVKAHLRKVATESQSEHTRCFDEQMQRTARKAATIRLDGAARANAFRAMTG